MLIDRNIVEPLLEIIDNLQDKVFDFETQYKMIKLYRSLIEERAIFQEQIQKNCEKYFETDANGVPIRNDDGGFKIKKEAIRECETIVQNMDRIKVSIPDIYFSKEELKQVGLKLGELNFFWDFIKK